MATVTAILGLAAAASGNHSTTDLVSAGQINGNGADSASFAGASSDGTRAFFATTEQLVSADTDAARDLYERAGGVTSLVSTGPAGGNADMDATFAGASSDGQRVFFTTNEALVAGDSDSGCTDPEEPDPRPCRDVYERSGSTTTLVSSDGNGAFDADFVDTSADGLHVFITTNEPLVAADSDSGCTDPDEPGTRPCQDVYERFGGTTVLVSNGGNATFDADFGGASADGLRVLFTTSEPLVAGDTDGGCPDPDGSGVAPCSDVYQRAGGTTTLLSTGPINGNGTFDVNYGGASSDGTRVFFTTFEQLVSADADGSLDVYERASGATALVSAGQINGNGAFDAGFSRASSDGTRVVFVSYEQLAAADTDSSLDVYERASGVTTLVSAGQVNGNGAFDVFFRGANPSGSHVFFATAEQLTSADTDSSQDVYQRAGGTTTLVSAGQINGNGAFTPAFRGVSDDGSRVFFTTRERLVSADSDPAPGSCVTTTCSQDVYERFGGITYLLSFGPDNGNKNAIFNGAFANGNRAFYSTAKQQLGADTDTAQDVYLAGVPQAGYPRPKGATPLTASLVLAYSACASPNRTHGPPLAFGSCNPPAQTSQHLTIGSPDANGRVANFAGTVRLDVLAGNPSTPADEADVRFRVSLSDVRNAGSLTDYTGEVLVSQTLRVTDRFSGSFPQDTGTVEDFQFQVTVPCAATANANTGATCTLDTTTDAVVPGAVIEQKRAIWQVGQVQVFDGGADGDADTGPNTLFAVQGIFVP